MQHRSMYMAGKKKILLVTRPLVAPWDEASKNFAHDLAVHFEHHARQELHIMTAAHLADVPAHVVQHIVYTQSHFSLAQKLRSLFFQWRHRHEFEIMHYMFTPATLNAWVIKTFIKTPSVKTIQTLATLRDDLYVQKDLEKLFFADIIAPYSRYRAEKIKKILPHKKIATIYPGVDLRKFLPEEKNIALMRQWQIAPTDHVVTYPGEFARLGATDLIIDAFLDLWNNPKNHHIKYLCACRIKNAADAKKKKAVIARFDRAGHRDKVIFTDTFGDMNAVFNLSDTVIFPVANMHGKFDIPLALIEPYACKKPVIVSNLQLFSEFTSADMNVIIDDCDAPKLAHAIMQLHDDIPRRARLGENAYQFIHKTFDISQSVISYQELYEQL